MKKIIVRSADVKSFWETDYGDYRARISLAENEKPIGDVIVSYEREKLFNLIGRKDESKIKQKEIELAIGVIVLNEDFENLKMLPKIKQCSKLMQRIYDEVCESESSMCFIENGDEEVSKDDIKILQDEVKKYGICDDIVFGEDDCLVTGYSNIETDFIDDRGL